MSSAIEAWFEVLPEHWQARARQMRGLLLSASLAMREECKYKLPFYVHRNWMCYLALQKDKLIVGFIQGRHLLDGDGLLARTDHKLIRHFRVPANDEAFDPGAFRQLMIEAVLLNEEMAPRKRPHQRARRDRQ